MLGQRVAQARAEVARGRGRGNGQIDQRKRGRRIVKEKAVKRPILPVNNGQRRDGRTV